MKIRKQIGDLTLEDLRNYPIWEYAHDEECEEGQDEQTVRPHQIGEFDFETMFIAAAAFTLADGRVFHGFVAPAADLAESQPCLLINENRGLTFWNGIRKPTEKELDEFYADLGGDRESVFPISWSTVFLTEDLPVSGVIDGIYYLDHRVRIRVT